MIGRMFTKCQEKKKPLLVIASSLWEYCVTAQNQHSNENNKKIKTKEKCKWMVDGIILQSKRRREKREKKKCQKNIENLLPNFRRFFFLRCDNLNLFAEKLIESNLNHCPFDVRHILFLYCRQNGIFCCFFFVLSVRLWMTSFHANVRSR